MIIYQLKPTFVANVEGEILKVFPNNNKCIEEFDILNKINEPLVSKNNPDDYKMSLVKPISIFKNVLIMEHASGIPLIKSLPLLKSVTIVGECLAKFHLKNFEINGIFSPRIFGDFSIDHIYINTNTRSITTFDPGTNFMSTENQLEDIARFLFSVAETFRYKPFISQRVMRAFIKGYTINKEIDFNDLKKIINFRKKQSIEKYKLQKSYFRARVGFVILNYNHQIIRMALRR